MKLGSGIAIFGIWLSVAACAFSGVDPMAIVVVGIFAAFATVIVTMGSSR